MTSEPLTLFDKIWQSHVVRAEDEETDLLYVDFHLVHEVTSVQAFHGLARAGRKVRRPELTLAVQDHSVPTRPDIVSGRVKFANVEAQAQLDAFRDAAIAAGVPFRPMGGREQGIVHVIGPELGLSLPGTTIVCGDSHTSTHGALGALAFGIGTSEVEHVLATQTLAVRRPRRMAVEVEGRLPPGVSAKDLILSIIRRIGVGGGVGHVIEYRGPAIGALSVEERMTVCNMSIEAGARAGLVAPDETTFAYLQHRRYAPRGKAWEAALDAWRALPTDPGANFDKVVTVDACDVEPTVTWGTTPEQSVPVSGRVPSPEQAPSARHAEQWRRALDYMGLNGGEAMADISVDKVFIGSCTNSRIEDLRRAAAVLRGRTAAPGVQGIVVPGSQAVKAEAEAEGLDGVFVAAGLEWREPGCSMCIGMNGDLVGPEERCASTSNRNFEGRQGYRGRTHLVSPEMAAAAAVAGHFVDVRTLVEVAS